MFARQPVRYRRTDFLSVLLLVVGLALTLTVAMQADAANDPCRGPIHAQQGGPVLDSTPLLSTGAKRCRSESTSASWASAIWGVFTH